MTKSPLHTVFYNIEKAIKLYRRMAQKKLKQSKYKITIDQILVLWLIDKDEKNSQGEIAELLFKDLASITRMIELLVKKEYVTRSFHQTDRRRFLLQVTKKGKEILEGSFPTIQANRARALQGISAAEIEILNNILTKIIHNCQNSTK